MARQERLGEFKFLLEGDREPSKPTEPLHQEGETPERVHGELAFLLEALRAAGIEAFAVDLTSVEAYSADMRVVRVVIPGLQPLPYRYATRYLAHPRLYEAPRRMGYRSFDESGLNPWPLPFA